MSTQVWFETTEVTVDPGGAAVYRLTVENAGDTTDTFTIVPSGIHAAWTRVSRPSITVFEGSRDTVEVTIHPPAVPSTTAGPSIVAVRVTPDSDPNNQITAETTAIINGFEDRRISFIQPIVRGRRRCTYEFMVENHGNQLATCRLHLVDHTERIDGTFDPPAVGVAPGDSALVRFKGLAHSSLFRIRQRQLDFEIEALEPDCTPAIGRASFLQSPTVSANVIRHFATWATAIGLIIAGWFFVAKPHIEHTVTQAIATIPTNQTPASRAATIAQSPAGGGAPAHIHTATPAGNPPTAYRISVDVGTGQEASDSLSLPPDAQFLMTDVVVQNLNGDSGVAQLLHNGDVIYRWDLDSMHGANEFQPRVTPYPFKPGDRIVLSVQCSGTGNTSSTGCETSVLIAGRLVPATAG